MVHDKENMSLVAQTLDHDNPREWYYALMDYGVMLKQTIGNASRKKYPLYPPKALFKGQIGNFGGKIIRILTERRSMAYSTLFQEFSVEKNRLEVVLNRLIKDGMVQKQGRRTY